MVDALLSSLRVQVALKASLAAAVAWLVAEGAVRAVPGEGLAGYLYYAPLGAVVATDASIAGSVRIAAQSILGLALGAGLGLAALAATEPGPVSLGLVVGAGVIIGSLPWLGDQRAWVPVVALFVLVIGGSGPEGRADTYATAYVGLTALGALCGVAVNLLLPSVPFRAERRAVAFLRSRLAEQVDDLAEALRSDPAPSPAQWRERDWDTRQARRRTKAALGDLMQSQRGNPFAVRHRAWADAQTRVFEALEWVALFTEDLFRVLSQHHTQHHWLVRGDLAPAVGTALEHLAALVRCYDEGIGADAPELAALERSVAELTEHLGAESLAARGDLEAADIAVLGGVVSHLRRAAATVRPADGAAEERIAGRI